MLGGDICPLPGFLNPSQPADPPFPGETHLLDWAPLSTHTHIHVRDP